MMICVPSSRHAAFSANAMRAMPMSFMLSADLRRCAICFCHARLLYDAVAAFYAEALYRARTMLMLMPLMLRLSRVRAVRA